MVVLFMFVIYVVMLDIKDIILLYIRYGRIYVYIDVENVVEVLDCVKIFDDIIKINEIAWFMVENINNIVKGD